MSAVVPTLLAAALAIAVGSAPSATAAQDALEEGLSRRSLERLRYRCHNQLGRRDVTLFANGTVRLRVGPPADETMWLHELSEDQLDAYVARLAADSRAESEASYSTVEGEWIERCRLAIDLPDRPPESYDFGPHDTHSLELEHALAVARELIELFDPDDPAEGELRLPHDYRPRLGDRLLRADGEWFVVNGLSPGGGLELQGVDQPVTLYLRAEELSRSFVAFERRERPGR